MARFEPGAFPYAWRLQAVLSASVRTDAAGVRLPLHDDNLSLDLPGLAGGALRLGVGARFRLFRDAGWYGPGGDSSAGIPPPPPPPLPGSTDRFHSYARLAPGTAVTARILLWEQGQGADNRRLQALLGAQLDYSRATVDAGSLLDQQAAIAAGTGPDAATLRGLLHGLQDHALGRLRVGLLYNSRDHEFQPTRGLLLEAGVRAAPLPASLRHGGLFASATAFTPLWGERLVLGGRASATRSSATRPSTR